MGTGQRYKRQGQHVLGTEVETFLPFFFSGLCGLLTPSPQWGQTDLKKETEGPDKGSAASLQVLTPSPFHTQASFATEHPKDKVHLSPCPRSPTSLWLKMDSSRPYQQQQVLLVCFLLETLQGPEQSLPIQKASHDNTAGSELCSGQSTLPALWERPFKPTEGCEQVGRGSDLWQSPGVWCAWGIL